MQNCTFKSVSLNCAKLHIREFQVGVRGMIQPMSMLVVYVCMFTCVCLCVCVHVSVSLFFLRNLVKWLFFGPCMYVDFLVLQVKVQTNRRNGIKMYV